MKKRDTDECNTIDQRIKNSSRNVLHAIANTMPGSHVFKEYTDNIVKIFKMAHSKKYKTCRSSLNEV